jgi:integrase
VASIAKRPNGRYKVSYRDPDGGQHSKTFKTIREANRFVVHIEQALEDRTWRDPKEGKRTLATVAETWLGRKARLKPGTLKGYRIAIDKHIVPTLGDMQVARIEAQHIDKWMADLRRKGVGETVIVRSFRVLGSIFDLALEYRMIPASPMPREKPRLPQPQPMRFLTSDEINTLAEAIHPRHRTWLYTVSYTGIRWSEAAGLKVKRLDLMRRRLDIVEQLVETAGVAQFQTPKTKNGTRSIPIPRWLADLLAEQVAGKGPDDLVFTTKSGTNLRPSDFHANTWKPALKRAGLEGVRIHDLRHTHVAMLIEQGEDPKTISERLGHFKPSFTMDRYAHVTRAHHEEVADRLEAFAPTGTSGGQVIPLR